VFFGRFTALLRALVPSAAGMAKLPYRTFALWNALGGSLWATGFVLAGYIAGASYQKVASYLGQGALALTAAVVVIALTVHFVRKRRASASDSSEH
jgi:membrane protein DedA with SNARE-associated domain